LRLFTVVSPFLLCSSCVIDRHDLAVERRERSAPEASVKLTQRILYVLRVLVP